MVLRQKEMDEERSRVMAYHDSITSDYKEKLAERMQSREESRREMDAVGRKITGKSVIWRTEGGAEVGWVLESSPFPVALFD